MRFPGPPLQAWPACIPGFVSKGRQIHVRYMLKLKESHTSQTSLDRHKTHVSGHPLSKSQVNRNKGQRVLGGAGLVPTLPPGSGHSLHKELQTDRNAASIQSHHQDREPGFRGMFVLCPNHDLVQAVESESPNLGSFCTTQPWCWGPVEVLHTRKPGQMDTWVSAALRLERRLLTVPCALFSQGLNTWVGLAARVHPGEPQHRWFS